MIRISVLFVTTLFTMLVMDTVWLGILIKDVYLQEVGPILLLKDGQLTARMPQAALVYLAMVTGVLVFGHRPITESNAIWREISRTALLGVVIFSVYDMTNFAVLSLWTWKVAVLDILWGGTLFGVSRASLLLVDRILAKRVLLAE